MNFTIEKTNKNLMEFRNIQCGTLFLDEKCYEPYICVPCFTTRAGNTYDSICLSDGTTRYFPHNEKVFVPTDHELKIYI